MGLPRPVLPDISESTSRQYNTAILGYFLHVFPWYSIDSEVQQRTLKRAVGESLFGSINSFKYFRFLIAQVYSRFGKIATLG